MESGDVVKGVQQAIWQFLDSYRPFQTIADGVAIGQVVPFNFSTRASV